MDYVIRTKQALLALTGGSDRRGTDRETVSRFNGQLAVPS